MQKNSLMFIFICVALSSMRAQFTLQMTVTNDILDCPHFSMVLNQIVEKKFQGTLIEKNLKEKYITFNLPENKYNYESVKEIFRTALDSVHFPATSVKEITIIKKEN